MIGDGHSDFFGHSEKQNTHKSNIVRLFRFRHIYAFSKINTNPNAYISSDDAQKMQKKTVVKAAKEGCSNIITRIGQKFYSNTVDISTIPVGQGITSLHKRNAASTTARVKNTRFYGSHLLCIDANILFIHLKQLRSLKKN